MKIHEHELHYDEGARSVHTLLRVIDPDAPEDAPDRQYEVLIDNLATAVALIGHYGWRIRQELIGFAKGPSVEDLGGGMTDEDRERGVEAIHQAVGEDPEAVRRVANESLAGWREHVSGPGDEALIIECYGAPAELAQAAA